MGAALLADQVLVAQNIFFGLIAAVMIYGAIRVVTSNNVVHAALWLVCVLAGAAAQYLLVYAEFVAVTQVLVYVGAVMVLFLFGVMLTRTRIGRESDLNNKNWALGIPVALVLFVAMSIALIREFKTQKLPGPDSAVRIDTRLVSDSIFGPYLLPFWALSFVLLVAVIGAIVLARKD
jgi:NADH-quinone oxidoreductase subunit J